MTVYSVIGSEQESQACTYTPHCISHYAMNVFPLVFVPLLLISVIINLGIAYYAWLRREAKGAVPVAAQMVATSWWTLCYSLLVIYVNFPDARDYIAPDAMFWFKALFVGAVLIPGMFLVFTLHFVNLGHWVNRYVIALLLIEPLAVTVMVWTDPYHQLFFGGFVPGDSPENFAGGIAFWIHSAYSYAVTLAAYALLGWSLIGGSKLHRRQTCVLILGAIVCTVANVVTIFKLVPLGGADLTPFGFMLLGLAMLYNIRGRGLLDLIPVARYQVVEAMADAVMVLDYQHRLLDINPAALSLLKLRQAPAPGTPVKDVFQPWETLAREHEVPQIRFSTEVSLDSGRTRLDAQATPLFGKRGDFLGRILVLRDVTDIKRAEAELRAQLERNEHLRIELQEQAVRDTLSGLFNRRYLEETLTRELAVAAREGGSVGLCMIDIDSFKSINDRYGHSSGDIVIKSLAGLLQECTRASDAACRFGGEEFVLVMPGVSLDVALKRIDELRERFASVLFHLGEEPLHVTFSAGVACYPQHATDYQSLLIEADRALYAAKGAGRNQVLAAHTVGGAIPV